jgi:1-acyl-sn-glycerol-3-phosphate acyltransferase
MLADWLERRGAVLAMLLRVACAWFLVSVVVASSAVVNLLQAAVSLLVALPAAQRLAACQWLANKWWNLFLFGLEVFGGVDYHFVGDRILGGGENAILIGNHERGLDFCNGIAVSARAADVGCGKMMSMLKASLRFAPAIGLTQLFQGSLFLKRDWERDRGPLAAKLAQMESGEFPRPFWIGMYPEGTRITAEKRKKSWEFAEREGLPKLEHVLLPRTKGFVFIVQSLPKSVACVYDVTTAYPGGPAFISHLLTKGRFLTEGIHMHVRRIPFSELPRDEKALNKWLLDRFVEKDRLLAFFAKHGRFPGEEVEYPPQRPEWLQLFVGWALILAALAFFLFKTPLVAVAMLALTVLTASLSSTQPAKRLPPALPDDK